MANNELNFNKLYKEKLINYYNFQSISNNTTLINVTNTTDFNISGNSLFLGDISILSNLNINNNCNINNNLTVLSNLLCNDNINIYNSSTILSNLNVANNAIICNDLSANGYLLTNNISCMNTLTNNNSNSLCTTNNLNTINIGPIDTQLNINGSIINIGNINSDINIVGYSINNATDELIVIDKLISLNLNYSKLSGFDNGNSSGLILYDPNGFGYIMSNTVGTNFIIKSPILNDVNIINTLDNNNNLYISGYTMIGYNLTTNSRLNIINNLTCISNITLLSLLRVSGNSYINNNVIVNNNLLANNINSNSDLVCYTNLLVNNNILCNNLTSNNNLFISGNSIINNNVSFNSSLNINNNLIISTITGLNNLYVSNNSIINGNMTLLSYCIINNNSLLNNVSLYSNLTVSNNTLIQNNLTIGSNITISGNTNINGNITFGSLNKSLNIYGKIIAPLNEYQTNSDATINGVPLWGFYRTGGIIKIRLENYLPIIKLNGLTNIYLQLNSNYMDLGVTVYMNSILYTDTLPYITSIYDNLNNNILIIPIQANQTNDLSSIINTSINGNYTIVYTIIDNSGNTGTISRNIIIRDFNTFKSVYTLYDGITLFGNINNSNYLQIINSNMTVECWVYITQYVSNSIHLINIFNNSNTSSKMVFLIDPSGYLGLLIGTNQINITSNKVPLNEWAHIVWMQYNNNIYGFINGIFNSPINIDESILTQFNSLTNINTINFGNNCTNISNTNALYGNISSILISSYNKYNLTSFIPSLNLTPLNNNNILLFIDNNIDIITSTTITNNSKINYGNRYIINYNHSYELSNGSLTSIVGNFTSAINNTNFTFELWLYIYNYNSNYSVILDTRDPSNLTNNSKCLITISSTGYPQIQVFDSSWNIFQLQSTTPIPLNRWCHVVWMRNNNIFYNYINGISYNGIAVNSLFNSLTNINNFSFYPVGENILSTTFRFNGKISQPIFRNKSNYIPLTNFIPNFDLTPNNDNSVIFFLTNNRTEYISNQILVPINNTPTLQRYYLHNNFILSQYNNNNYVSAYNLNNGWLGKEIKDMTSIFYGNNDFTVELWIYINYINQQNDSVLIDFRDPSTWNSSLGPLTQSDGHTNKFNFGITNGKLRIWYGNSGNLMLTNQTVKNRSWNHIVYMRKNNYYYGFINGYSDLSSTDSNQSFNLSNLYTLLIGRTAYLTTQTANYQFNGYVSQILIRNGAQYSTLSTFIPQQDLSSLNGNTVFYLNEGLTDVSNNIILPQQYNVVIQNRYLSYLLAYDTTNGSIGPISGNFNLLNNSIYPTSYGTSIYSSIIDFRTSVSPATTNTICLGITNNGYICLFIYGNGNIILSNNIITLNEWQHIVWSRLNNNIYCFINGVLNGMISSPLLLNSLNNMNNIVIGCSADQIIPNTRNFQFNGYISQIKISIGPVYDPTGFIPYLDLSLFNNNTNTIFLFNPNNTLTRNNNLLNIFRPILNKWIPTYNGLNNIFYKYNSLTSFDNTTEWTCEGWIYINSFNSNIINILSTTNFNNYNINGKIEFGFKNDQLTILNSTGINYSNS